MHRLLALLIFCNAGTWAQTIGNFTLTDIRFDKPVSLQDYSRYPAVVLIFTTNNCAFDEHYRERIIRMAEAYAQRVPFLLINSSAEADESVDHMKALHAEIGFTIPYLADKNQVVMNMLNARKTPECVVLKPVSDKFTVVYRGAIDDNPQSEADVREAYLANAIEKVLAGQPVEVSEHRPPGCSIR